MAVWNVIDHEELSGTASSWDVTSIPSSYDHLYAVVSARTDKSANYEMGRLNLNGDTGTNFTARNMAAWSAGTLNSGSVTTPAKTFIEFSYFPAASQLADTFGTWSMWIPNYANTANYKQVLIQFAVPNNSVSNYEWMVGMVAGLWQSTAAINQITLTCNDGTNDFVANSSFTLYGINGAG